MHISLSGYNKGLRPNRFPVSDIQVHFAPGSCWLFSLRTCNLSGGFSQMCRLLALNEFRLNGFVHPFLSGNSESGFTDDDSALIFL